MSILSKLSVAFCALFISMPMMFMLAAWFFPAENGLGYLLTHGLIWEYLSNSTLIAISTGIFSLVIGVITAWMVTMYDFPARRILSWLLILPFAIPAYVAAMIYGYMLEGAGPVQSFIRDVTGLAFGEYYFPHIRSMSGVVFILTITLYPYVYLMARAAFLTQSRQMLETGEMLGLSRAGVFLKLALPVARPAIITGVALVMMEALADYGVVSLFGVPSFTTGIYRIWQGFYDPVAAARLASIMLLLVLAVLWLERYGRGKARYENTTGLYHPLERLRISGFKGWLIALMCFLPILLGFVIPAAMVLAFSLSHIQVLADNAIWLAAFNSIRLGLLTAAIATIVGLLFAYALRSSSSGWLVASVRLATSGYAIPGSVIAVGVLLFLVIVQNKLFAGHIFLTGTMLGVVWGCTLRFLTISFNNSESGLTRITPAMDAAAEMLGAGKWRMLSAIHLPILKASLISGFILVFVDTLKELPATLLLRPFNFNTLAIRTYELAMDDLLPHAAPNALILVLISMISVWLLHRKFADARPGGVHE